jgi:type II secretory pathway pseudopilin PulG
VELVIVVVIIGLIAAIAIPRISRSAQAGGSAALRADLRALRSAIEQYRAEHEGALPTVANFVSQMTKFSNLAGDSFADSEDAANGIIYGPYLQAIPALPVGAKKGSTTVDSAVGAGVGWVYNATTGAISAGTAVGEDDLDGVDYNTY